MNKRFIAGNFIAQIAKSKSSILSGLTIDGKLPNESILPAMKYYDERKNHLQSIKIMNSIYNYDNNGH